MLFLSVFFLDFFHFDLGIIPRSATWIPEVLSVFTVLIVAILVAIKKEFAIHTKYVCLILLYFIAILLGIVLNSPPIMEIFQGMRVYLKTIPFFLLPAVYRFSEDQLKKQLKFILPLLILQCPLAVYQRLIQYSGALSGDGVTGTLDVSSVLSISLICSVAIIFAFFLRKKTSIYFFLIIACIILLPTTINATKGTLVLLPFALFFPAFLSQNQLSSRIKTVFTAVLIGIIFISAFAYIHDHFMKSRFEYGVLDFYQNKDEMKKYLYSGAEGSNRKHIYRGDAIILAFRTLSNEWGTFVFGLGIGNMTRSYFNSSPGVHSNKMRYAIEMLGITNLFWELGLLGVIVYVSFFIFLLKDTFLLKKCDDLFGSFALGWSAVITIISISMFYKNILHFNVINYLFWYFSGIVATNAVKVSALSKKDQYKYRAIDQQIPSSQKQLFPL